MPAPVTPDPVEAYLVLVGTAREGLVRDLDAAIRTAGPELTGRLAYKILMYVVGSDTRRWVVAIDVHPKVPGVRFLQGVRLTDPKGVLRAGSSTLKTFDIKDPAAWDRDALAAFVREAVAVHLAGDAS